jgi:pimeloyl-ACP methyl ester carboxylesterase
MIRLMTAMLACSAINTAMPALAQHAGHMTQTATTPAAAFTSPRIIVTVVGEGPDVVLIPGLGSSPDVWAATIAALPGYRYHLVQVKGFAGAVAEANATGPVVHPVAEEIVRYIRDSHLDHPALVGHSMGGTLGMTVATHHPELVGRLMVVDMFPFIGAMFGGPGATPDSVRPMAEQIRTGITTATGEARRAQTEGVINGMVRTEAMRAGVMADSMESDPAVMGQAYYDIVTTDLTPQLVRFTGPFTVLWVVPAGAPVDENMMGIFYRSAYAGAPQAVVTHIPDSAHFIMHDAPARFQAELRAFLTAAAPATPAE